jgi:hypothetical protein
MVAAVRYYANQTDALVGTTTNMIGNTSSYVVATYGGYTTWRIASNSTGSSSQVPLYHTGDTLNSDGGSPSYFLYASSPCFLEGTKILCQIAGVDEYVPIETIRSGTLVKTSLDGYKKVVLIGKGVIENPGDDARIENRLYKCSPANYPELTEDLYLTGCHSILVGALTDVQREQTIKQLGKIFVTSNKYRLIACVDERAEPWNSAGTYTIWHFALEHVNSAMNYGVYANGGLLVETCSLNALKGKRGLESI